MPPSRPALPDHLANSHIAALRQSIPRLSRPAAHPPPVESGSIPSVKFQILNVQGGTEILVGRLKVDTPTVPTKAQSNTCPAFILRRFDTGAVSLTSMFRAAFPAADVEAPEAEKREVQWVRDNYDLTGNNGSSRDTSVTRLAGTWVGTDVAVELGEAYSLGELIHTVVEAKPDPNANYRRSGKGKDGASVTTPSSPAPAPLSPKPSSQPMPSLTSVVKASKKTPRRAEVDVSAGSDETAVDDDEAGVTAVEESASAELREQDLVEQRELINNLKAQRDKARVDAPTTVKRAREDEDKPLSFDFKEPQVGERAIATNSRISPSQRSAVWGAFFFAFGVTAASFLPNLF
ncbi:hypothetical protein C8F01DRAFT_1208229 [Mycena amicta]|nr:hypothetical protein C8F01DRAFT_1208229 [Mycena amicta]